MCDKEKDMYQAVWNGSVLAESGQAVKVEGGRYFPPGSLNREYFTPSRTATACPWKGTASYYDITVGGNMNRDAAWYYSDPSPAASQIRDYVAFWHGVKVVRADSEAAAARGGLGGDCGEWSVADLRVPHPGQTTARLHPRGWPACQRPGGFRLGRHR
jgi:uncharacterized protein (DUF427 family)